LTVRDDDFIRVNGEKASVRFFLDEDSHEFSATIIPFGESEDNLQPENICARWDFIDIPSGDHVLELKIPPSDQDALTVKTNDGRSIKPRSYKLGKAALTPLFRMILSSADYTSPYNLRITEESLLKNYYERETHKDSYRKSPEAEHPFFLFFHQARMRTLSRIFKKYIKPQNRVLDVGSGYSMFFLIGENWDFEITCCDIDAPALDKMKILKPEYNWVLADAKSLPWENGYFDVLYAGEIIEHMTDPASVLREWGRVLKSGGILILTTPNRDRLLAKAIGERMPVHHEHLEEFNLKELRSLLKTNGFEMIEKTGIYLEFLINWWRPRPERLDLLTARFAGPQHSGLYKIAMEMGRIAPSLAFDLVVVGRKISGGFEKVETR